jgi:hypothetical protein
MRSAALNKLNRKDESFVTIQGALKEDPNNAYTHANYGWNLLEQGQHKKALEHFKESLSNNPSYEYAQAGMLEAIKATNPVYRLFLKYSFWMSNLTAKYQWVVIIGFYLGFRFLNRLADTNEALQPYLNPILVVLALFAISTWIIHPISNLFIRFHRYGQYLLDEKEKLSSNFVAISVSIFALGLILYFTLSNENMLSLVFFGFAMILPLGSMFVATKYKNILVIYTLFLSIVGALAVAISISQDNLYNFMSIGFLFGFIAYQWIANFMIIKV